MTPKVHVLFVGGDDDDREIYAVGLASSGIQTSWIDDSTDVPESVRTLRRAAVVLHLWRPEQHGWNICEALLADPECRQVPVVVLTAAVRPDGRNRERARSTPNCAAFVAKPCDVGTLALVLERVVRGERGIEVLSGY